MIDAPAEHVWWLASRASGIVALALVFASVALGLANAGRLTRRPSWRRATLAAHEHTAVAALVAIAAHAMTLLGDAWLHPGMAGVSIPFALGYRRAFTGIGVLAAYLAAALGLSFYARRRIGPRRWRSAHRASAAVFALAVAHAIGAGTD